MPKMIITPCIYCREEAGSACGQAHVLPEAICKNNVRLERGFICDPCNQYLGSLDSTLAAYPPIAMVLQWYRAPGKRGQPRDVIGPIRLVHDGDERYSLSMRM